MTKPKIDESLNTFPIVATSTSFANYILDDDYNHDNHPVDGETSDDFLELHKPKNKGLCELSNDDMLCKDGLLSNDGLCELVFEQCSFCSTATVLC